MTDRSWLTGWERLRVCYPEQVRTEADLAAQSASYRKYLDCLTDTQWEHAVGEALKHERFFPSVSSLLEYGEHAPARALDWTGDCPLCEGTGFEPFERGGYAYVRFCPRGCKVGEHAHRPDYRTHEERVSDAKEGLKRIEAAVAAKEAEVAKETTLGREPRGRRGRPPSGRDSGQVVGVSGGRDA